MCDVVEIEGPVSGFRADVAANQALRTSPGVASVATTRTTITTSGSDVLLSSRIGRLVMLIQNLDATNAVHLRLDDANATTGDLRLGPGVIIKLIEEATYEGEVRAKAVGASVEVVAIEYYIAD